MSRVIALICLIILVSVVIFFLTNPNIGSKLVKVKTSFNDSNQNILSKNIISLPLFKFEILKYSDYKSFPTLKNNQLILLPLNLKDEPPIHTKIITERSEFHANEGVDSPQASPDFKKIAFVKDGNLWLISADGINKVQLPENLKGVLISGWSPDSEKLLIKARTENISSLFQYFDKDKSNLTKKFDVNLYPEGYYLLNIKKGEGTLLTLVNTQRGFETWINPHKIMLVNKRSTNVDYIDFDLDTFQANGKTLYNKFNDYFGVSFDFDTEGRIWSLRIGNTSSSKNPMGFSKLIYASYPNIEGKLIAEGTWAEIQGHRISPDGKKVIYGTENYGRGSKQSGVWIWENSTNKFIGDGFINSWLDNDSFIYSKKVGKEYELYYYNLKGNKDLALHSYSIE